MNANEVFVDTNILIYAHDSGAGKKQTKAQQILEDFWRSPLPPSTSVQVLQECVVHLNRLKISHPDIEEIIDDYLQWNITVNDQKLLLHGLQLKEKLKISFWDAMIVAAAKEAGSKFLLTEDFQHNRSYEGVKAVNPFI